MLTVVAFIAATIQTQLLFEVWQVNTVITSTEHYVTIIFYTVLVERRARHFPSIGMK